MCDGCEITYIGGSVQIGHTWTSGNTEEKTVDVHGLHVSLLSCETVAALSCFIRKRNPVQTFSWTNLTPLFTAQVDHVIPTVHYWRGVLHTDTKIS